MDGGYALIYRRVLDDPDFATAAEALAFVYLILKASWRDTAIRYKGRRIELKRGQLAISVRDMGRDLEWSKSRCDRFLSHLEKRDKIGTAHGTGVNVVTICKYAEYQLNHSQAGTAAGQQRDSSGTQNNTGNNSVPEGTGETPIDPVKQIFDLGVALLVDDKTTPAAARSLIGRWRKESGDGATLEALNEARIRNISAPKEWVSARLSRSAPRPAAHYAEIERKYGT